MRAAPAVRASLDGARPERVTIALLHMLSAAALSAWVGGNFELTPEPALVAACGLWLLAAWALGWRLARSALPGDAVHLQWDGQAWQLGLRPPAGLAALPTPVALARLVVALDLGHWVLLRLHPAAGGQRWQVARAARAGADWHGLRVALAAQAGRAAAALGGPP